MSRIIDAKDRFSARAERRPSDSRHPSLDEKLRQTRVPLKDRPLLAKRIGELAVRLDAARPLSGAKQLFEKAWNGEKWDKRKRLVRLPAEEAPDAGDHGTYEASGANWAAIIRAASELIYSSGDQHVVARERERLMRDALRGTSFLPSELDLPVEAGGARELIDLIANRISVGIAERTRLQALWAILKSAPFTIELVLEEDHWPECSPKTAHEGDERSKGPLAAPALLANVISQPDWRGKRRFANQIRDNAIDAMDAISWANPAVKIGALAKRSHGRVFIIPEYLHTAFAALDRWEPAGPHDAAISAWFTQISDRLYRAHSRNNLPEQQFDESLGYGWQSFTTEAVRSVWLEVREKPDGSPGLWVSIEEEDNDIIPVVDGQDICQYCVQNGKDFGFYFLPDSIVGISENLFLWPAWINEVSMSNAVKPGGLIGLAERPAVDWCGEWESCEPADWVDLKTFHGWIDDGDNNELAGRIFTRPEDIRFIPTISADADGPLPCPAETVVAALIANASAPEEERLAQLLVDKARAIADAGLEYHNAVIAHHRAIIEAM